MHDENDFDADSTDENPSIDFQRNPSSDFLLNTERCIAPGERREMVSRLEDTPFETFLSVKGPEKIKWIEDGCKNDPPSEIGLYTQ